MRDECLQSPCTGSQTTHRSHQGNSYLIALGNLADNLSCRRVDGGEGFLADCVVPFIVYEDLQWEQRSSIKPQTKIHDLELMAPSQAG